MNHEQLIKRADEILKARTGFSVPEEEIKELLTSWRPCSENPEFLPSSSDLGLPFDWIH